MRFFLIEKNSTEINCLLACMSAATKKTSVDHAVNRIFPTWWIDQSHYFTMGVHSPSDCFRLRIHRSSNFQLRYFNQSVFFSLEILAITFLLPGISLIIITFFHWKFVGLWWCWYHQRWRMIIKLIRRWSVLYTWLTQAHHSIESEKGRAKTS